MPRATVSGPQRSFPLREHEHNNLHDLPQTRSHERLAAKDAMDQIRSAIRTLMEREPSVIGASGGFAIAKLRVRL